MKLTSSSFQDNGRIPAEFAFCVQEPKNHITLGQNRNPQLEWADLPMGTKSLALICRDPDVPSLPDDVNKEGRTIPASLPRIDFFHWILIDLDPQSGAIAAGEFSDGVTPRGKPGPQGPRATRQGLNDYSAWFAHTEEMRRDYFGYDGPCPPWNDEIPHHYVFTLYALDVAQLPIAGPFRAADALNFMRGHVLDEASLTGIFSVNPKVPAR